MNLKMGYFSTFLLIGIHISCSAAIFEFTFRNRRDSQNDRVESVSDRVDSISDRRDTIRDHWDKKYDDNFVDSETSTRKAFIDPCMEFPCGPNAECHANGMDYTCKCMPDMINQPPNCRAECTSDSHCADDMMCIKHHCKESCGYGVCGPYAKCRVEEHKPICECIEDYTGDPYLGCSLNQTDSPDYSLCDSTTCGKNTMCIEQDGEAVCFCLPNYYGNPDESEEGCMPKCKENSDCPTDSACMANECRDPCPAICPENSDCQIENHMPMCTCKPGYTGDYRSCSKIIEKPVEMNACRPNPCGPNSQCKDLKGMAACSCLPGFHGYPPNCMDMCQDSDDCDFDKACIDKVCADPCEMNICGMNANCSVSNHSPICKCANGFTGNPFNGCQRSIPKPFIHPCANSHCGPNAECQAKENNDYSCYCLPNYIGQPPNCRPECQSSADCADHMACVNQRCKSPCSSEMCGENAVCRGRMHTAVCECPSNYIGDAFVKCVMAECITNNDCPSNETCMEYRCLNPCMDACGTHTECTVVDHTPVCTCKAGYAGDPLNACYPAPLPMSNSSIEFIAWYRTETTMLVMFKSDDPDNLSFTEYRVTLDPPDAENNVLYIERETEPSKFVEAGFNGLMPGRAYNISVQTKLGNRLSIPIIVSYHTIPSKPMHLTLDKESLTSTSFHINWKGPKNHTDQFDVYEVAVQSESGSLEFFEQKYLSRKEGETNGFKTKMTLKPGHTYKVTVKTVSGKAKSWPDTIYVTTRPLPVKNLKYSVDMETDHVTIWWTPNEMSRQDEYKISYFEVENGVAGKMGRVSIKTNRTNYMFGSFVPNKVYSLSVQAISKNIESKESTTYVLIPPGEELYF